MRSAGAFQDRGQDAGAGGAVVRLSPLIVAAICWMLGTVAGRALDQARFWLIAAAACAAAGVCFHWQARGGRGNWAAATLFSMAIIAASASWWGVRGGEESAWGLESPTGELSGRLVRVEGVIDETPLMRLKSRGLMGRFDFRGPTTLLLVRVDRVSEGDDWAAARARVVVGVPEYDGRWRAGDRVRCTGWFSAIGEPRNPGERDRRGMMRHRGVVGRVSLDDAGNCELIESADGRGLGSWRLRDILGAGARWSLREGLDAEDEETPAEVLLDSMLLGDRTGDLGEVEAAFQRTGLSHLLAVSGLNLGIVVGGSWWLVLVLTGRPRVAAAAGLVVVGLYLLMIPPAVPIVRAGITTSIACWSMTWGRRTAGLSALSLAAIVLLAWNPSDLFSAGFQLSFGIVAGLLVFTSKVSRWLSPAELVGGQSLGAWLRRCGADYSAVTLVSWAISLPLVAWHFNMVSLIAPLVSFVMLPLAASLFWLGHTKMVVTVIWPAAGAAMEGLPWWCAKATGELAQWAADLPGAYFNVASPSGAWVAASLVTGAALLGGVFAGRIKAATAAVLLCAAWIIVPEAMPLLARDSAALRMEMFAVGNGSCYLLRSGGRSLVFDCGSSNYPDITTATIGPALRTLGVHRVDALMLSHPDSDHFSGSLELIDQFRISRVLLTEEFVTESAAHPREASQHLLNEVRRRGVAIEIVAAGWREPMGEASLEILWPPAGRHFAHDNDGSIVLRVSAANRRVLMCGDAAHEALGGLLSSGADVRADVMELPHHGSFIAESTAWLAAVKPTIVLQSTARARLRSDAWALRLRGVARHITARDGMVELRIDRGGGMETRPFRESAEPKPEPGVRNSSP